MFVKFVLLRQSTLASGQANAKIEEAPSAILLGNLAEMKSLLSMWLEEGIKNYEQDAKK